MEKHPQVSRTSTLKRTHDDADKAGPLSNNNSQVKKAKTEAQDNSQSSVNFHHLG